MDSVDCLRVCDNNNSRRRGHEPGSTHCEEKLGGERAVMIKKKKISVLIRNTQENISDVINGCDP